MADKQEMGKRHVRYLAELLGLRETPGSGNQWKDPIDARSPEGPELFRWAAEAKSTLGGSIAFSRDLIAKAREQAGGERPMIGLRFYRTEDLQEIDEDWVAVLANDFGEMSDVLMRLEHPMMMVSLPTWTEDQINEFRKEVEARVEDGTWSGRAIPMPSDQPVVLPESEAVRRLGVELQSANSAYMQAVGRITELEAQQEELLAGVTDDQLLERLTQARMELAEVQRDRDHLAASLSASSTNEVQGAGREVELRAEMTELQRRPTLDQHREVINQYAEARAKLTNTAAERDGLRQQLEALQSAQVDAARMAQLEAENEQLRADQGFKAQVIAGLRDQLAGGPDSVRSMQQAAMASPPPRFPWLSIFQVHDPTAPSGSRLTGIYYDALGNMDSREVHSIRIENEINNDPRLIVNEHLVRAGELWVDGRLHTRVGA